MSQRLALARLLGRLLGSLLARLLTFLHCHGASHLLSAVRIYGLLKMQSTFFCDIDVFFS